MSTVPTDEFAALSLKELYGCTYLCGATFANAREWRQHELSTHRQTEMWRCSVTRGDGGSECGATFHSADALTAHLSATHGVGVSVSDSDSETLPDGAGWVQRGHIHAEGQVNFWCGFCRRVVALDGRGVEAWAERLDHLQDHFDAGDSLARGWLRLRD